MKDLTPFSIIVNYNPILIKKVLRFLKLKGFKIYSSQEFRIRNKENIFSIQINYRIYDNLGYISFSTTIKSKEDLVFDLKIPKENVYTKGQFEVFKKRLNIIYPDVKFSNWQKVNWIK